MSEVRLSSLRAEGGELRAVKPNHIFILGMHILEGLENGGIIVVTIRRALISEERYSIKFFVSSHNMIIKGDSIIR